MIAAEVKYKQTKFLWLPEIPEHWKLFKVKHLFSIGRGRVIAQTELIDDGLYPVYSSQTQDDGVLGYINTFDFEGEMLTWTTDGVNAGSVFHRTGKFNTTNVCGVLNSKTDNYTKFLYYALAFVAPKCKRPDTNGAKIMNNEMAVITIPVPPLEEQKAIADYLDAQSAKITRFIQTKQRFIELLKEQRQSIIEIALKSEENWTKSKIKHIAKMFGRIGFRGYQTSDLVDKGKGAITISPSNMKDNKMDFNQCSYLSWAKYEESPEIKIFQGDILFVKTGATYGKVALVPELPEKATINPQLMVFKELKIDAEYFCFYLQTGYIKEQVEKTVIGGTIPTISQTKVGTFQVFYPSPTEQKRIVKHIKTETRTLDIAISKAEREIELIKEYREAMIAEAVTGKMKL